MFIGMTPPPTSSSKNTPMTLASKTEGQRRVTQEMHEQEYQQALITVKDKIRESEGPNIKETMMDQIRQWFIECRDATGKFPDFPADDEGGSAAIFKERTADDVEAERKGKLNFHGSVFLFLCSLA